MPAEVIDDWQAHGGGGRVRGAGRRADGPALRPALWQAPQPDRRRRGLRGGGGRAWRRGAWPRLAEPDRGGGGAAVPEARRLRSMRGRPFSADGDRKAGRPAMRADQRGADSPAAPAAAASRRRRRRFGGHGGQQAARRSADRTAGRRAGFRRRASASAAARLAGARMEAWPAAASASAPGSSGMAARSSSCGAAGGVEHLQQMPGQAEAGDIGHRMGVGRQDRGGGGQAGGTSRRRRRPPPRPGSGPGSRAMRHFGGKDGAGAERLGQDQRIAGPRAALGDDARRQCR